MVEESILNLSSYTIGLQPLDFVKRRFVVRSRVIVIRFAVLALLALSGLAQAGARLFTYGPGGQLLSESEAAIRPGGAAYVSRDVLLGAAAASIRDSRGALHPVVWVLDRKSVV